MQSIFSVTSNTSENNAIMNESRAEVPIRPPFVVESIVVNYTNKV